MIRFNVLVCRPAAEPKPHIIHIRFKCALWAHRESNLYGRYTLETLYFRAFFVANGMLTQEWERVRTDWLTVRPAIAESSEPLSLA
jgi:hypothetical protein